MNALKIENIEKRFGKMRALDRVSLSVDPGEFCVLLGASGCGKSTLLRIIAGLETADAGEITIGDRTVTGLEAKDRDVAMVFQTYALYPHLTVRENLAFPLRVRGMSGKDIDDRVREAAGLLRIEELLSRRPRELSGGQRQRVAIGRAIVRRPRLFLFDEPLSNLDAQLRATMRVELARLHRLLGTTVIYVTHDQVEAMTLGSRIALMNEGRFEQVGPPDALYSRPATRFAARFVGSPAMNLIDGAVREGRFEGAGLAVAVSGPNGPVALGIRPEDLAIEPSGPWKGKVDLIENLGAERLVYLRCGETVLTLRDTGGTKIATGQDLSIHPKRVHVFGADGRRIET